MAFASLLDEALEAWAYTRAGVIAELKNLPDVSLAFRPTPTSRSAAEIAVHIAESGLMMSGELSRPDGNFQRKSFPQFMKEYARGVKPTTNKKQLVQLLTKTHEDGEKKLQKAGELHMLQLITRFDGERGSRLAWMNHAVSHEEYHRGQIALYARLVGRVPALTQVIYGKSK
ncbi:MAG TPA: DinB family protein [Vicinamibacterales bacterium]|nr:DinB family protein [Vicinamibacterales bacterium]